MTQDVTALMGKVQSSIEEMKVNNAAINASLKDAVEKSGSDAKAAIETADKLAKEQQKIAASLTELEQKLADGVKAGKASPKTLGEMVVKSEAFKQFAQGNTSKFRIEANTIIGQEGSPPENSDTLVAPQRLAGIIPGAFRALRVRDVLPQGTTNSNAVEYTRELAFTNAAQETA
jgi:hypothetical protein